MGFKRRKNVVSLAQELSDAQADLDLAAARVEEAKAALYAAVAAQGAADIAIARRGANGRRSRTRPDWDAAQKGLLRSMKAGELYTGSELQEMAGLSVSASRFISNVRNPLLHGGSLKKLTRDGRRWKKGMSPKSVRWSKG